MAGDRRALTGVGGWLAVFVATLILSALGALVAPALAKSTTSPWITVRPGWSLYLLTLWVTSLIRTGGFTFLAWLLFERQLPSTPRLVIWGLWLVTFVPVIADRLLLVVLLDAELRPMALQTWPQLIGPAVYAGVWTAYLLRSRRVANTYGANPETLAAVFE